MTKTKKRDRKINPETTPATDQTAAPTVGQLSADTAAPPETKLPRGQERLPDGTIRLKASVHDLGSEVATYDVHGVRLQLSGKVLVAGKDVNWLAIGECQKCHEKRPEAVIVHRMADGHTVLMFTCQNTRHCELGGYNYVQVHSPGRFLFRD